MTAEKEYAIQFTEQHIKANLNLHYNEVNSYLFVNEVEIYKLKAKDSEINSYPVCLGNISKNVLTGNMERLDYMDISMIFQLIMIVLMLITSWISITI